MSLLRFAATVSFLAAAASASSGAQLRSQSATVAVSLRVLPHASFEAGPGHRLSAELTPGEPLRVDPSAGVRTRIAYGAATVVTLTATPLRGPGGITVPVRVLCRFGAGVIVLAAEPFDCVGGLVAEPGGASVTVPIAVGAELSGPQTVGVPRGVYAGVVTLTAAPQGY